MVTAGCRCGTVVQPKSTAERHADLFELIFIGCEQRINEMWSDVDGIPLSPTDPQSDCGCIKANTLHLMLNPTSLPLIRLSGSSRNDSVSEFWTGLVWRFGVAVTALLGVSTNLLYVEPG